MIFYIFVGLEILTKCSNTLLSFYLSYWASFNANAQFGSHEVGVIAGPVAFQSDYGQRYDLNTNAGNTGLGIGIIHYINFPMKQNATVILLILILMTTLN
jgi:hypothetical protein